MRPLALDGEMLRRQEEIGLLASRAEGLLEVFRCHQDQGEVADGEAVCVDAATAASAPDAAQVGKVMEELAQSPLMGVILIYSIEAKYIQPSGLSAEETGAIVKLAVKVKFDLDAAKQLHTSGRLSDIEKRAFEKLLHSLGR